MRTDSIWYQLFLKFPGIFFELIGQPPAAADFYRFESVEVKQLSFRLDGVFLPATDAPELPLFFLEVQFQRDPNFCARFFSEIFLYLRDCNLTSDWQAVAIYPTRSLEACEPRRYREFFSSGRLRRFYLEELLEEEVSTSVGLGILRLVVEPESQAGTLARQLIQQARQDIPGMLSQRDFIELIETIMVYKLPQKSRQEIETMLGLSELRQTKVYQEAKQEAKMEAVPRLLRLGLTVEQIAEALEMSLEEVRQAAQSGRELNQS